MQTPVWFSWEQPSSSQSRARHCWSCTGIPCLNLVPCKFEIQFKSYRVIVMKCCPPASRNFLSASWFDSWVGQSRQNQQAASTNSFKVYNASIQNTTSSQGHPKSSFVAKCLSSVGRTFIDPCPKLKAWLRVSPLRKIRDCHLYTFLVGFRTFREKITGLFIPQDLFKHYVPMIFPKLIEKDLD